MSSPLDRVPAYVTEGRVPTIEEIDAHIEALRLTGRCVCGKPGELYRDETSDEPVPYCADCAADPVVGHAVTTKIVAPPSP
jgi:hypothetical protein